MIRLKCVNIEYKGGIAYDFTRTDTAAIIVKGHAVSDDLKKGGTTVKREEKNKADAGVCAAVSALSLNLVRSLHIIAGMNVLYREQEGEMLICLRESDLAGGDSRTAGILIESFLIGMMDLKKSYPQYVSIETVRDVEFSSNTQF